MKQQGQRRKSCLVNLIISTLLLAACFSPLGAQESLSFPDLDMSLIELWYEAEMGNTTSCKRNVRESLEKWNEVEKTMQGYSHNIELIDEFIINVDNLFRALPEICDKNNMIEMSGYSYHIMWEFRMMRYFLGHDQYSLDILWDMYDEYEEIVLTVHDEMFGLLSWVEFMDRVDTFSSLWDRYRETVQVSLGVESQYDVEFRTATEKVDECLSYFLASLESAYRTDFELPCDELGTAVKDLIRKSCYTPHMGLNSNQLGRVPLRANHN